MKYLIILGLIVLAWAPWLSKDEAQKIVDGRVMQMQQQNKDLCAMYIYRDTIRKVPFGYTEDVSYDCTVTDTAYGVLKSRDTVFIAFYGGIIGMPNKTVEKNLGL